MKKITILFMAILGLCGVLFMGTAPASAAEPTEEQTQETSLADAFLDALKEKYGDQWQQYYDAIIAEWGTVEEYLLSLVPEDAPEAVQDAAQGVADFLRDNQGVIVTVAAVLCVVIVAIVGGAVRSGIKKLFARLFADQNKKSRAMIAQSNALNALMGENKKFEDKKAALSCANEEMMKGDVDEETDV